MNTLFEETKPNISKVDRSETGSDRDEILSDVI